MTDRKIDALHGKKRGPTVIFIAGLHGNEPSGIEAIKKVFAQLKSEQIPFRGSIIGLYGNIAALEKNVRFLEKDLNRIWTQQQVQEVLADDSSVNSTEQREQKSILFELDRIFEAYPPPYYFLDLHTTSAPTVPFLAISDSLKNRTAATHFPVPIILGIEEHVEGSFLNFINDLGHVALGFEAGQHADPVSIERHASFIWTTLHYAKLVRKRHIPAFEEHLKNLEAGSGLGGRFFEVSHREPANMQNGFQMEHGYKNFQWVTEGDRLARTKAGTIEAVHGGRVFMPLYQQQGEDGFFLINYVPRIWLVLSAALRKLRFEWLLSILPGVNRAPGKAEILRVNTNIARFLALEIFHLLGYRRVNQRDGYLEFRRRDIT
jgi:hypothetical protein